MKFKDILDVDSGRLDRARDIDVSLVSSTAVLTEPSNFLVRFFRKLINRPYIVKKVMVCKCKNTKNGSEHKVAIEVEPQLSKEKLLKSSVKVYCSCPDFMYRSAYTLNKDKSLFVNDNIIKRLGIALTQAPTRGTSSSCKHVVAVYNSIKKGKIPVDFK